MWDNVVVECAGVEGSASRSLVSLDVAAGTGKGALELARRGFLSTALDLDKGMLAEVEAKGAVEGLAIRTLHGPAERTGIPDHTVDLVVTLQAFHWFDAQLALEEFRRVLKPRGVLVVAWNDRDLAVPWVSQLEDVIERFNLEYNRKLKLSEVVTRRGAVMSEAGIFEHISSKIYENPTPGMTGEGLVQLLRTMSYVRNALDAEQLGRFEAEVRDLVRRHHGDQPFVHPWLCKTYTLRALPKN
jgi:ubiquinone/menaquinone biosynthesis C-methylase UbiE